MIFSAPIPFEEALASNAARAILPTTLRSVELAALGPRISERAFFMARVTHAGILQEASSVVAELADGLTDQASARLRIKQFLDSISYDPGKDAGTIKDLRSDRRLNLMLETNTRMIQARGTALQGQDPDVLDAFPAQELFRAEDRKEPREWIERWRGAGGKLYGGRMIARKDSPVWVEISRFSQPYPPFDFNSGMDVRDIDRDEAESLGVLGPRDIVQPTLRDFNADLQSGSIDDPEIRRQLLEDLGPGYTFDGDILTTTA